MCPVAGIARAIYILRLIVGGVNIGDTEDAAGSATETTTDESKSADTKDESGNPTTDGTEDDSGGDNGDVRGQQTEPPSYLSGYAEMQPNDEPAPPPIDPAVRNMPCLDPQEGNV